MTNGWGADFVLSHYSGVRRRRGFKDIGIDAFLFKNTIGTVFISDGTDNTFEGISEAAP